MKFAHSMGRALDRVYGVFVPERALARMVARARCEDFRRMYAAARPTDDAGGWLPLDEDSNAVIRSSSRTVRARIRQLVRDFPYFARAVNMSCAFTIGAGIRLQVRMYGQDGKLDRKLNEALEEAWLRWAEHADTTGRLTFTDLQNLAERQRLECGEYLFIKRYHKRQFRLQPIEPDRLTSFGATPDAGNEIEQGIEFDPLTGTPRFYWFEDDYCPGGLPGSKHTFKRRTVRVPASQVIHGYQALRPGQLRGISPLVSCVMVAGDLADLLDSELDATRIQSKYLGFVSSTDPAGFQNIRNGGQVPAAAGSKRRVEHLDNATLEYLRTGDTVTLATINRQGNTFEPFLKFNLRTLAIGTNLTYEILTGDYAHISYSNLRGIRLDLALALRPTQLHHVEWLCRPAFGAFLDWKRLTEPALLPYGRTLEPWNQVWIGPGQESADPLKEVKAFADELNLGVRSPQEWAARRGRDLEEILDEIAEAKHMMRERGLEIQDVQTALATNPAALMEGNGESEEEEHV